MSMRQSVSMALAEKLVTKQDIKPPKAALKAGVAVQSIYRAAWYKAWRNSKKTIIADRNGDENESTIQPLESHDAPR